MKAIVRLMIIIGMAAMLLSMMGMQVFAAEGEEAAAVSVQADNVVSGKAIAAAIAIGLAAAAGAVGMGIAIAKAVDGIALSVTAAVLTIFFTLLDTVITPFYFGYTAEATKAYFYASVPVLVSQVVCAIVTVLVMFIPLEKVFRAVKL